MSIEETNTHIRKPIHTTLMTTPDIAHISQAALGLSRPLTSSVTNSFFCNTQHYFLTPVVQLPDIHAHTRLLQILQYIKMVRMVGYKYVDQTTWCILLTDYEGIDILKEEIYNYSLRCDVSEKQILPMRLYSFTNITMGRKSMSNYSDIILYDPLPGWNDAKLHTSYADAIFSQMETLSI